MADFDLWDEEHERASVTIRKAYKLGQENMRERAIGVAVDWFKTFGDQPIKFVSAQEYASSAVLDIGDGIRALPIEEPHEREAGNPPR